MTVHGFTLFNTSIGQCSVVWGERGVVGLHLPEATERATRARILREFPGAVDAPPSHDAQVAIDGVTALLSGEPADLSTIRLDMGRAPPFHQRVYEAARTIPPGSTLTYGEVARRAGAPGAARAVGQALGRNPFAIIVPCHRVLAAGGRAGGFSANGGVATKLRLLAIEGALTDSLPRQGATPHQSTNGRRYGLDPLAAMEHIRGADAEMAPLIDAAGPFALEPRTPPSVFGALAEAIVYQQLANKAAAAIYGRVCALFPDSPHGPAPEDILQTSDDQLRGAGLSRPKLLALRDLAGKAAEGAIPTLAEILPMDDEAIVERLTIVRGVGRWTVEMLLIFRLGRADVLPLDDYALRKGFALAFGQPELPERKALQARGARWKPYRTVASWYLWRALDLARK